LEVSVGCGLEILVLSGWKMAREMMVMSLEGVSFLVLREQFPLRCANNVTLATAHIPLLLSPATLQKHNWKRP